MSDVEIKDGAEDGAAGTLGAFTPIKKFFEETGHTEFQNPAYYKTALSLGGNAAARLHDLFQKLNASKEPQDRTIYRQKIIPAFWEYFGQVAATSSDNMPAPHKFLLRFAMLHPGLLQEETRKLFSTVTVKKETAEPVFYMDEWFAGIGRGQINPSGTDEVRVQGKGNNDAKLRELLDKAKGKTEGSQTVLVDKERERGRLEEDLKSKVGALLMHNTSPIMNSLSAPYSEAQRKIAVDIQENLKALIRCDRELEKYFSDYENALADTESINSKMSVEAAGGGSGGVKDTGAISGECQTINQMVRMTIGRQGNAFPILSGEYFHCIPNGIGTRENVLNVMAWIESIDEEVFYRVYKNKPMRIVPYVILLPTYGDRGVCWEPFERTNKATSRAHVAIPMYPKNLTIALLCALGDLRWQVAKEKASYYWTEEGLTGNYYQWFTKQKLKGDIKSYFVQDYLLWMTKESDGTQKLDKELRGIFWRYMPFTRPIKEKLKDRNLVYQELYQRDLNRAGANS